MNGAEAKPDSTTTDIHVIPPSPYTEVRKSSFNKGKAISEDGAETEISKNVEKSGGFFYDPQKKTVLGRSAINWAKLAAFYTVFYFCLGCFFVILLYGFALLLDRQAPRYFNKESTMAVRTTFSVVGMGFRPQPDVTDNLIRVTDDFEEKRRIASSLRLFRDVYLIQKNEAKAEDCTEAEPASALVPGTACTFNWFHIVPTQDHPCSDDNMYGFRKEEPCVLVKLNKVYGWMPVKGQKPSEIQKIDNENRNKSDGKPDVYITCGGSQSSDRDVLHSLTYYSLKSPNGSPKYGVIPYHFFPYQNAPDHVQPFVLVQFKDLPLNRLISVTCRAWAPNIQHDTRGMRGMVSFQLYRSHKNSTIAANLD